MWLLLLAVDDDDDMRILGVEVVLVVVAVVVGEASTVALPPTPLTCGLGERVVVADVWILSVVVDVVAVVVSLVRTLMQ